MTLHQQHLRWVRFECLTNSWKCKEYSLKKTVCILKGVLVFRTSNRNSHRFVLEIPWRSISISVDCVCCFASRPCIVNSFGRVARRLPDCLEAMIYESEGRGPSARVRNNPPIPPIHGCGHSSWSRNLPSRSPHRPISRRTISFPEAARTSIRSKMRKSFAVRSEFIAETVKWPSKMRRIRRSPLCRRTISR